MLVTNGAHFPLAFALISGDVTLEEVASLQRFYEELHAKNQRFATIIDARRANVPSSIIRRALADMSNSFGESVERNTVAVVLVIDSPLLVGALRAIRWFMRMQLETQYQTTPLRALAYIEAQLKVEGIAVPAGARDMATRLERARATDYDSFAA